jgi:hypothetical protein
MDLTPWQRGRKKRCKRNEGKFCRFTPLKAGFHHWRGQHQGWPWAFETDSLWSMGPEDISWWKICLPADLLPVRTTRTTHSSWWNSGLWLIGHLIHRTWTHWTSLCGAFYRQKSQQPLTIIWIPYVCPSLWNGTSKWWNTSAKPATHSTTAGNQSLGKI